MQVHGLNHGDLAVMNAGSLNLLLLDSLGDLKEMIGRFGVQLFHRDSFVTLWPLRGITGTPEQVARTLRAASPPTPVPQAEMDRLWERAEAVARRRPDMDYMTFARQAIEVWGESVPRPFHESAISDGSETLIKHFAPSTSDLVEWSL